MDRPPNNVVTYVARNDDERRNALPICDKLSAPKIPETISYRRLMEVDLEPNTKKVFKTPRS